MAMESELKILRPKALCRILGISIASLYRWEKEGKLPIKKIKFGPNCVGYRRSDVEAWLNGELDFRGVN